MTLPALNPKQQRFVQEYLIDHNATQAAIRAGYSARTAEQGGAQLLRNIKVRGEINKREVQLVEKTTIDQEWLDERYRRIADADIGRAFNPDGSLKPLHEMDEETRFAISGVEVETTLARGSDGDGGAVLTRTAKIKSWDKLKALDALAKNRGYFPKESKDVNVTITLEALINQAIALRAERSVK